MVNCGCILEQGGYGLEKDQEEALGWYKGAANKDFAVGYYSVGECYYFGHGTKKDLPKARVWLNNAATRGCTEANVRLGIMMVEGEGGARDLRKCILL